MNELDYVVFYEKPIVKLERIFYQHLKNFQRDIGSLLKVWAMAVVSFAI